MKGFVYILSNPSMPGLIKIGRTTRDVEQRMDELYQTGVPQPFELMASEFFPDCHAAEISMHDLFSEQRVDPKREFFRVDKYSVGDFESALSGILRCQVEEMVSEFMPDAVVRLPERIIDECDIMECASLSDEDFYDVADCLADIAPEAIKSACETVRIRRARWRNSLTKQKSGEEDAFV